LRFAIASRDKKALKYSTVILSEKQLMVHINIDETYLNIHQHRDRWSEWHRCYLGHTFRRAYTVHPHTLTDHTHL